MKGLWGANGCCLLANGDARVPFLTPFTMPFTEPFRWRAGDEGTPRAVALGGRGLGAGAAPVNVCVWVVYARLFGRLGKVSRRCECELLNVCFLCSALGAQCLSSLDEDHFVYL